MYFPDPHTFFTTLPQYHLQSSRPCPPPVLHSPHRVFHSGRRTGRSTRGFGSYRPRSSRLEITAYYNLHSAAHLLIKHKGSTLVIQL